MPEPEASLIVDRLFKRAAERAALQEERLFLSREGTIYGVSYHVSPFEDEEQKLGWEIRDKVKGTDLAFYARHNGLPAILHGYSAFVGHELKSGILKPEKKSPYDFSKVETYDLRGMESVLGKKDKLLADLASVGINDETLGKPVAENLRVYEIGDLGNIAYWTDPL